MNEKTATREGNSNGLEWHLIEPKSEFYDDLEHRHFQNATSETLIIGFGHDIRMREIIAIAFEKDAIKSKDPAVEALVGEIVEEEIG